MVDSEWGCNAGHAQPKIVLVDGPTPHDVRRLRGEGPNLRIKISRGADAAGEQYQFLQQYRGIVLPGILRSVDRLLGLLTQTMGNLDHALTHFEDAQVFCGKAGYRPELA